MTFLGLIYIAKCQGKPLERNISINTFEEKLKCIVYIVL